MSLGNRLQLPLPDKVNPDPSIVLSTVHTSTGFSLVSACSLFVTCLLTAIELLPLTPRQHNIYVMTLPHATAAQPLFFCREVAPNVK